MSGLTTSALTNTNHLKITIPDELKGIELQIIILRVVKESTAQIECFSEAELQQMPAYQTDTLLKDE